VRFHDAISQAQVVADDERARVLNAEHSVAIFVREADAALVTAKAVEALPRDATVQEIMAASYRAVALARMSGLSHAQATLEAAQQSLKAAIEKHNQLVAAQRALEVLP
jgi:hypothetical protein